MRKGIDFPLVCQHCTDAPCQAACPTGALYLNMQGEVVLWKGESCIGCGLCFVVCPVGAIFFEPSGERIRKCDLCGGDPQCVKYCEPKAIQLVDRDQAYLTMGERMAIIHTGGSLRRKAEPKKIQTEGLKT